MGRGGVAARSLLSGWGQVENTGVHPTPCSFSEKPTHLFSDLITLTAMLRFHRVLTNILLLPSFLLLLPPPPPSQTSSTPSQICISPNRIFSSSSSLTYSCVSIPSRLFRSRLLPPSLSLPRSNVHVMWRVRRSTRASRFFSTQHLLPIVARTRGAPVRSNNNSNNNRRQVLQAVFG